MGYSTKFKGQITITPPLNPEEVRYLKGFNETRRMNRALGPYFTDTVISENPLDNHGQKRRDDIIDYNNPFPGDEHNLPQPGLWCGWTPTEDGTALVWDRVEKFYYSEEWMRYLIRTFLTQDAIVHCAMEPGSDIFDTGWIQPPEFAYFGDHTLEGVIEAQGEDYADRWDLIVSENEVSKVEHVTDPQGYDEEASYGYDENKWAVIARKGA